MIYTVTFSPALDYVVELDTLKIGEINRSNVEYIYPGGKGINISIVLKNLGVNSTASGFLGGFTGQYIEESLKEMNIGTDFVTVKGNSRINVKIKGTTETAINANGPLILEEQINQLIKKLQSLKEEDYLILSGAIPKNLPTTIYQTIIESLKYPLPHLIIDTTKDTLLNTLKYHPFLVKPNLEELEEMFNTKAKDISEILNLARKLQNLGALNVIVSLGKEGALLLEQSKSPLFIKAPNGEVKNTVGAGDSMIAGFLAKYIESKDIRKSFVYGIATGSASAFSLQLATKEEVERLFNKIKE